MYASSAMTGLRQFSTAAHQLSEDILLYERKLAGHLSRDAYHYECQLSVLFYSQVLQYYAMAH